MPRNVTLTFIFDYLFGNSDEAIPDLYVVKEKVIGYSGSKKFNIDLSYLVNEAVSNPNKQDAAFLSREKAEELIEKMQQTRKWNPYTKTGYLYRMKKIHWWYLFYMWLKMWDIRSYVV